MRLLHRKEHTGTTQDAGSTAPAGSGLPGMESLGQGKTILFPVPARFVEVADTAIAEKFIEVLGGADIVEKAQGRFGLIFPDYEDTEFVFVVPEVRRFVRTLHHRVPHLLYFLDLDEEIAQLLEFMAAFSPDDHLVREGDRMNILANEQVERALREHLAAVWTFARGAGVDPDLAVARIGQHVVAGPSLPAFVAQVREAAGG
jgi:hypothetical protein